jgi:hypothetical protein
MAYQPMARRAIHFPFLLYWPMFAEFQRQLYFGSATIFAIAEIATLRYNSFSARSRDAC